MLTRPGRWTMRDQHGTAVVVTAFIAVAWAAEARADGLTQEQIAEMEDGTCIRIKLEKDEQKGFIGGTSYALIDQDIDKIWNAITDADVYPKIYPTTIESKTVYEKGNKSLVKMVQGNKVVKATYFLDYTTNDKKHKLSWKLNKSKPHDIHDSRGYFRFAPYKDGRILMKMVTVVDLGNAVIEKLFGNKIARGMLKLPMKFRRFLKKPEADKYVI
jgi:ribosome-associated toxin RatA of RatAB toxin-antitoxin module